MGRRGREPRPASGRRRGDMSHRWGSLTAPRRQPAPHLAWPPRRPSDPLFGARGEGAGPSSGAPCGTDEGDPRGARSRRLAWRRILRDAGGVPGERPHGRDAGSRLGPRMHTRGSRPRRCYPTATSGRYGGWAYRPAGLVARTPPRAGDPAGCAGVGAHPFPNWAQAPGGDVCQCVEVFNSCSVWRAQLL